MASGVALPGSQEVRGLGFRGLGFRVWGLGFRVEGFSCFTQTGYEGFNAGVIMWGSNCIGVKTL